MHLRSNVRALPLMSREKIDCLVDFFPHAPKSLNRRPKGFMSSPREGDRAKKGPWVKTDSSGYEKAGNGAVSGQGQEKRDMDSRKDFVDVLFDSWMTLWSSFSPPGLYGCCRFLDDKDPVVVECLVGREYEEPLSLR